MSHCRFGGLLAIRIRRPRAGGAIARDSNEYCANFVFMAHAADRVPKGLHVVVAVDHLQGAVLARLGQILEHRAGGGQRSEGVAETQIRNALRFYRL